MTPLETSQPLNFKPSLLLSNLTKITLDYNKATDYLHKNNFKKAFVLLKKCLAEYEFKEGYCNIGNCYRDMGNDKEMFRAYKKALSDSVPFLDPESGTDLHAMNNLGLAYYMMGDDNSAINLYLDAIERKENFWEAHWNLSTALLRKASSGEVDLFPKAWEEYKARFLKTPPVRLKNRRKGMEYWKPGVGGEDIVVLTEQGIGDSIMWGRFLAGLRGLFKRVFVQCHESLEPIFSDYICVRDAADIISDDLVAYPICSLADGFSEIPSGEWLNGKFRTRSFESGFNVGIVWSGSSSHANDRYRSVSLGRFKRLSRYCNLYNLSPSACNVPWVRSLGIKTWTDTAECINGLDLVICVDTSVAHLAGSLELERGYCSRIKRLTLDGEMVCVARCGTRL